MSSVLKPFITDITTTNTATLDEIPKNEINVITEKNPSFPLGFRYLLEIHSSSKNFLSFLSVLKF